MAMTVEELLSKIPQPVRDAVAPYAPAVIQMTADELKQWLEYVFVGKTADAYALYLSKSKPDLVTEWQQADASWKQSNTANAAQIELSRQIGLGVCKALLPLILAAVGL